MSFVYHFKPKNLIGEKLLPLNRMKIEYPEVFKSHSAKYRGREAVMAQHIPPLSCSWNDATHLSPIHPKIIRDTWRKLGFQSPDVPTGPIEVFQVPVKLLRADRTATFQANGKFPSNDFMMFDLAAYKELVSVPDKQIEDWYDQKRNGVPLFWYSSIMHIVTVDELNISDMQLVVTV